MKEEEAGKIGFLLSNISTLEFATIDSAYQEGSPEDLQLGFGFGILEEERWIVCDANVEFHINNRPFIIIKVRCEFEIDPNAWERFVDYKKNTITFPDGLLRHLAVLTTGTTRGILHAKTENTKFNQIILPTLNIADIVSEPITFDIDAKK
ncbi:hypothetical protein [Tunicatimonas pelagia]|uniref:hypothetical protein n=1 Tax=Tunicatimonas pelagia TaxID=931531 RepID=UPI002666A592|nr:hypothetical protein [Tunicatimonas pelagia]WKN45814.1 hypothetical protein P0M28_12680 [Tunicatimonas pelagia]